MKSKKNYRAFTLVELLVVMGIIAVLMSILLPSIAGARRQARIVQCMSSLRSITQASIQHAADHRGFLPLGGRMDLPLVTSSGDVERIPQGLGDTSHVRYAYATAPSFGNTQVLMPWHAAIARYLAPTHIVPTQDWDLVEKSIDDNNGVWKFFMCPDTDSLYRGTTPSGGFDYPLGQASVIDVYVGGSANYVWSTNTDFTLNEGVVGWASPGDTHRRLRGQYGKLKYSAQTVLFTDGQRRTDNPDGAYGGFSDGWQVWTPLDTPSNPTITLDGALASVPTVDSPQNFDTKRHKNKINIAFLDGHVETRDISANGLKDVYLLPPP